MKVAKKVLALVIAFVMIGTIAVPEAFAKISASNYESYKTGSGLNSIDKFEFTSEQAAGYILDLVDQMLYEEQLEVDEDITVAHLYLSFKSIDDAFFYIYHAIEAVAGGHSKSSKIVADTTLVSSLADLLNLKDLDSLTVDSLHVNNEAVQQARCVPTATRSYGTNVAASDITVMTNLLDFLGDNGPILAKLANGTLDVGTIGGWIVSAIGGDAEEIVNNLPEYLKKTLYTSLWDETADTYPSGWTYDKGIQDLVNWLLIDGTGSGSADGGNSTLGPNTEGLFPAMLEEIADDHEKSTYKVYDVNGNLVKTYEKGKAVQFKTDKTPVQYYTAGYYGVDGSGNLTSYSASKLNVYKADGTPIVDAAGKQVTYDSGLYIYGADGTIVFDAEGKNKICESGFPVYTDAGVRVTDGSGNNVSYFKAHSVPTCAKSDISTHYYCHSNGTTFVDRTNGGATITSQTIVADRGEGYKEYTMGSYQLVNNAINGLLNGMLYDLLLDVLVDALDIGKDPDEEIMSDMIYMMLIGTPSSPGLIESLCCDNGAPSVNWEGVDNTPLAQVEALLDWFLNRGGLSTLIKIDYNGIEITDAFMGLLTDLLRMVPTLMPLLGIEVPSYMKRDDLDINVTDEEHGQIYQTWKDDDNKQYDIYLSNGTYYYVDDYYVGNKMVHAADSVVNTTNQSAANYHNPDLIKNKKTVPTSEIWAYIVKILLNSLVPGCYFPDYANSVASVGAYALASIAEVYMPENNYWERLDKYYCEQNGKTFVSKVTDSASVKPLAYTETIKIGTRNIEIPRAVMDIGASLGSYFLNGAFPFADTLGHNPSTDTTFESYLFEFLLWGGTKYVSTLLGGFDSTSLQMYDMDTGVHGVWQSATQAAVSGMYELKSGRPVLKDLTNQERANIVYTWLDETLFTFIPSNWLPTWLASSDSSSSSFFNEWLFNSVMNIDLQQIFSLIQINADTSKQANGRYAADFANDLTYLLIQIIYRVFGFLFGGDNILPATVYTKVARTMSKTVEGANGKSRTASWDYYNVFENPCSITNFESLLSGNGLFELLRRLLDLLDYYGQSILVSVLPLVVSFMITDTVKDFSYTEPTTGLNVNYLGDEFAANGLDLEDLKAYYEENGGNYNAHLLADEDHPGENVKDFRKRDEAEEAVDLLSIDTGIEEVTVSGVKYYRVIIPNTYATELAANVAANYFDNSLVSAHTAIDKTRTYSVYINSDYRTGTSNETSTLLNSLGQVWDAIRDADDNGGIPSNTTYTYSALAGKTGKFTVAQAITNSSGNRTGDAGQVYFTDGYRYFSREDFSTANVYKKNRIDNALELADDFIDDYYDFVTKVLPNAYGEWMAYYVNLQLKTNNLWDSNNDGKIVTDSEAADYDKGIPGAPGSMYPFSAASGSINYYEASFNRNTSYAFATYGANSNYDVIKSAIALGQDSENDVVLTPRETQNIVRLALGATTNMFDITNRVTTCNWESLEASSDAETQFSKINALCQKLGFTFNREKHEITRPAFAYITSALSSDGNFGTDSGVTISLTPAANYSLGAKNGNATVNDVHDGYLKFAQNVKAMNEGLYNHYDDISWRLSNCEKPANLRDVNTDALKWVLSYTKNSYIDAAVDLQQSNPMYINRKKVVNTDGGVITTSIVTKYTTSSFEEFQKAYEYGQQLLDYLENDYTNSGADRIRQSLVTEAFRSIMAAYYSLKSRTGFCNWGDLVEIIETARGIIYGPLGYADETAIQSANYGYTEESLNNLKMAIDGDGEYEGAWNYYLAHKAQYDDEYQDEVDGEYEKIRSVIAALEFKTDGENPDIVLIDEETVDNGDPFVANENQETAGGSLKTVYLTGLKEGSGLGYYITASGDAVSYEDLYTVVGININNNGSYSYLHPDGDGTTAKLVGKIDGQDRVQYVAVIYGDLNKDARIDGADKTILEYYLATGTQIVNEAEQFAADVDRNGEYSYEDVAAIYNHYNNINKIDQNREIKFN